MGFVAVLLLMADLMPQSDTGIDYADTSRARVIPFVTIE